jgi:hypothetical protein|nr:MAG TPA: hypothetical protein [Caudoviricetes sp.]DAU23896.1 MAG TPA: hypothetical protein [Caudoviricetes sp.]
MVKLLKFLKYVWFYKCLPIRPSLCITSKIKYNQPISYYWQMAMKQES